MPSMAGQLKWAVELKAKMSFTVKSFKDLNHPICYREGAKMVFRKYKEVMQLLVAFEEEIFQMWNLSITKKMTQSLNRSLILRDTEKNTLRVNFGRDVMSVLREVSEVLNLIFEFKFFNIATNGISNALSLKTVFPVRPHFYSGVFRFCPRYQLERFF